MNDVGVLLDVMRAWLALLSIGATLLWLLYPQEPGGADRPPNRELDFTPRPDPGGRVGAAALGSTVLGRRSGINEPAPVSPAGGIWRSELLDMSTGKPARAGARATRGGVSWAATDVSRPLPRRHATQGPIR